MLNDFVGGWGALGDNPPGALGDNPPGALGDNPPGADGNDVPSPRIGDTGALNLLILTCNFGYDEILTIACNFFFLESIRNRQSLKIFKLNLKKIQN